MEIRPIESGILESVFGQNFKTEQISSEEFNAKLLEIDSTNQSGNKINIEVNSEVHNGVRSASVSQWVKTSSQGSMLVYPEPNSVSGLAVNSWGECRLFIIPLEDLEYGLNMISAGSDKIVAGIWGMDGGAFDDSGFEELEMSNMERIIPDNKTDGLGILIDFNNGRIYYSSLFPSGPQASLDTAAK